MEINLTKEESELYFYNSLCNGIGQLNGYGIRLEYESEDYDRAKRILKANKNNDEQICYEDVLMQILRNGDNLRIKDEEGGEDSEQNVSIALADVHNRVCKTPIRHLSNMMNENDDADTADVILQTVFFKDIIFG